MDGREAALRASLRTPRAAGVAGIVFSVLLASALLLIRLGAPSRAAEGAAWLTDPAKRRSIVLALNLVPFAGIAFLWFMGVIRDRIGEREDRFFATVFLGSGLLFVGLLFVGAAMAGGMLTSPGIAEGRVPSQELWELERRITFTVINIYAVRMGAVFILSTTTIGIRTRVIPTWLAVIGFAAGAILLLGVNYSPWVNLVLPAWAFLLSVNILLRGANMNETA